MKREDYIGLGMAYLGCLILTHWMIWSHINYGIYGTELSTYITTLGGILG